MDRTYGQVISGTAADGSELQSGVFNENEVRAAAGLTMVVGAVAFVYAYFNKYYVPLQVVATFFFAEFLIRVTLGLQYSPTGIVGRFLTQRNPPDWVYLVPGCKTVFQGESEEEILEQVSVHAREDHGMDEVPPEVVEQIQGVITEV